MRRSNLREGTASTAENGCVLLFNVRRGLAGSHDSGSDFLGMFYLAAVLEEHGLDSRVFHGDANEVPDIVRAAAEQDRIVAVGFSCDHENRTLVEELSCYVKETYDFPVITGGPQSIALKEDFFIRSRCDYVVRGEAELTLPKLLAHLERPQKSPPEEIAGLTWLDPDGRLHRTPDAEPLADLDALPFPAYHRSIHTNRTYGRNLLTGRGCPFSCAFCFQSTQKRRVRTRSLDKVLAEVRRNLTLFPALKYIAVLDDTFALNPQRVADFCEGIKALRRERDFCWYCEGHIHLLARWPNLLSQMKDAGLIRLQLGIESGCQRVLDAYDKKITIGEIEFVVEEAVRAEIPQLATNLIFGGPHETEATVQETKELAERLLRKAPGVIDILTGFLRPYPKTAIAEDPGRFGLAIRDPDGEMSLNDFPMMGIKGGTPADSVMFRRKVSCHILQVMADIQKQGKVPHDTILKQYRTALKYGVTSQWYKEVFTRDPLLHEYYRLLAKNEGRSFEEVSTAGWKHCYPLRTMEIRRMLAFEEEMPILDDRLLSPFELELLLHCSAKLDLEQISNSLFELFGDRFADRGQFDAFLWEAMASFDKRHWIVFSSV